MLYLNLGAVQFGTENNAVQRGFCLRCLDHVNLVQGKCKVKLN